MFVPDLHPATVRQKHRVTFFGDGSSHPVAVLTPINALFKAVVGDEVSRMSSGWWPNQVIGDALVVLTPQGSAIVDALGALEPDVQIVFAGLAGALDALAIGDIVEPSVAIAEDQRFERTSLQGTSFRDVTVATVACLGESIQRRDSLRQVAHCVDMETAWVFALAARQHRRARAVLAISDHVYQKTFVETPLAEVQPALNAIARHLGATG